MKTIGILFLVLFFIFASLFGPIASSPTKELHRLKALRLLDVSKHQENASVNLHSSMNAFEWVGESLKIQLKLRKLGKSLKLRDFSFKRLLGSGTYGDVYLAQPRDSQAYPPNSMMAVKFYKTDGEDCLREYYFQTFFDDQKDNPLVAYMIHAYGAIRYLPSDFKVDGIRYYHAIFYEYMPTSLSDFSKSKVFDQYRASFVKAIAYKVLEACLFLEQKCLIHLDLKPGNLMVIESGNVESVKLLSPSKKISGNFAVTHNASKLMQQFHIKMIDFGMSADLNNAKYGISRNRRYKFGTGKYRPLEAFLGSLDLTQAYDMWSVGIMLLELALDDTLFGGLGKQNHYIIPVLMSLYFRESGQSGFPTDANFLSIESMPGYFGAQQLYDRLVKEETANEFERRQLTRYFADNLVKQARDTLDPEFYDLIMKLLRLDPSKRLKASEALNHRYFDDLKAIIAIH